MSVRTTKASHIGRPLLGTSIEDRLLDAVQIRGECWVLGGYYLHPDTGDTSVVIGKLRTTGRRIAAHLWLGLDLGDKGKLTTPRCKNRRCISPDHIEIVERKGIHLSALA